MSELDDLQCQLYYSLLQRQLETNDHKIVQDSVRGVAAMLLIVARRNLLSVAKDVYYRKVDDCLFYDSLVMILNS